MKWIYTEKIRPLIPNDGKELFTCAACSRKFDFQGVFQHFGTKHTDKFYSKRTGALSWQESPWPQVPHFKMPHDPASPAKVSGQMNVWRSSPSKGPCSSGPTGNFVEARAAPEALKSANQTAAMPPECELKVDPLVEGPQTSHAASPVFSVGAGYQPPDTIARAGSGFTAPAGPFAGPRPNSVAAASPYPSRVGRSLPQFPSTETNFFSAPDQAPSTDFQKSQRDEVANIASAVAASLSPVKAIPPSVRMQVIIHHVIERFRFHNKPNLDLFMECLEHHFLLRSLKDITGLACKTCVVNDESPGESQAQGLHPHTGGRRIFSFLSLLSHFQNVHKQHCNDWKEEMIELPSDAQILELSKVPGMEREAFNCIASAFPRIFGAPEILPVHPSLLSSDRVHSWLQKVDQTHPPYPHTMSPSAMEQIWDPLRVSGPSPGLHQSRMTPFSIVYEDPNHFRGGSLEATRPRYVHSYAQLSGDSGRGFPAEVLRSGQALGDGSFGQRQIISSADSRQYESYDHQRIPRNQQQEPYGLIQQNSSRPFYVQSPNAPPDRFLSQTLKTGPADHPDNSGVSHDDFGHRTPLYRILGRRSDF